MEALSATAIAPRPPPFSLPGARIPAAPACAAARSGILTSTETAARARALLLAFCTATQHCHFLQHQRMPMFLLLLSLLAAAHCLPSARRKHTDSADKMRTVTDGYNTHKLLHNLNNTLIMFLFCSSSYPGSPGGNLLKSTRAAMHRMHRLHRMHRMHRCSERSEAYCNTLTCTILLRCARVRPK